MKQIDSKSFILYADCIPTKGIKRSIVTDLTRLRGKFIPNLLYEILTKYRNKTIEEIKSVYMGDLDDGLDRFIKQLVTEEYGFLTSEPEKFPLLSLEWDFPGFIENAIIDFNENSSYNVEDVLNQLEELGCIAVSFRFYISHSNIELISKIIDLSNFSSFRYFEFILPFNKEIQYKNIREIIKRNQRIRKIIFYGSPQNEKYNNSIWGDIIYTCEKINDRSHCGVINSNYFSYSISSFSEAQKFNTCLNRKISVDTAGEIRNCPSMIKSYGNIKDTSLQQALNKKGFKNLWNINKDIIAVCKDCEFKYICTDCRAYTEEPHNIYSKPLKCGYDPYSAKWEEWSTNPLKQKTIEYYGMEKLTN